MDSVILPIFVYALEDPRTGKPRYVGQTTDPDARLRGHMHGPSTYNAPWLAEVKAMGLKPVLRILATTDREHVTEVERHYTTLYGIGTGSTGHGGSRAGAGRVPNPEHRRIARAVRLTPEDDAIVTHYQAHWGCTYTDALARIIREYGDANDRQP